jgi:hypothetical protein
LHGRDIFRDDGWLRGEEFFYAVKTREHGDIEHAAEIAGLAPGSMLVECDTAGMLTPPERLNVHVYRWTGSRIEFEKTVPLHELDFVAPAPQASAAEIRAGMLDAMPAAPLRLVPSGDPIGRLVSEF